MQRMRRRIVLGRHDYSCWRSGCALPGLRQSVQQLGFDFANQASDGLELWREQQREALRRLGSDLGLPVGARCEVVLLTGLLLRGQLLLEGDDLFHFAQRSDARFRIGEVNFSLGEIASCARLDST